MEKLHDAVNNRDAAQIAQLFQHKRIPTKGLDTSLLESSDVAAKCLDRFVKTFHLPILQALLLSPTAYEIPWKATHAAIQVLSSRKDVTDEQLESTVMLIQTFLQQVAAEWNIADTSKMPESKEHLELTDNTPRRWIERLLNTVLQSTSPQIFRILSTLCSLAQSTENDFHKNTIRRIAEFPDIEGCILEDWLRLLRTHTWTFDVDTWIVVMQTFSATIQDAPIGSYSPLSCMQCLLSLHRAACGKSSSLPKHAEEDILWHRLAMQMYELSYLSNQQSLNGFPAFHKTLESSLTGVSSEVLLKWLRWTFQVHTRDKRICIGMALAIFRAWSMSSQRQQSTGIKMAPILYEELGKFVFSGSIKDGYNWTGENAVAFLNRMLPLNRHYRGQGVFAGADDDDDDLLTGVAKTLYQTINGALVDPCTAKFLVDGVFESIGSYFEVFKARDLLLCTLLMAIVYESQPSIRTHSLTMLRERIDDPQEGEGTILVYCIILRVLVGSNPSDDTVCELFSLHLMRTKSSDVSIELKKALISNRAYQTDLCSHSKRWITSPLPTDCSVRGMESESTLEYLCEGLSCMTMLVACGSPETKDDSLAFISSVLDGSTVLPSRFYKEVYVAISKMITLNSLETWMIEILLRSISKALRRKLRQYNSISKMPETEERSLAYLHELICLSKAFTVLLEKDGNYGEEELIGNNMQTYNDFLDALFTAFIESSVLVQATSSNEVPSCRTLDVSSIDIDVAGGFSALSSLYESILGGTKVISIDSDPPFDSTDEFSAEANAAQDLFAPVCLLSNTATKENLMHQGRLDIAHLCLDKRVWKDKPTSQSTPFVRAVAFLCQQSTQISDTDAWKLLPHHSILSAAFTDISIGNIEVTQIDCILSLVSHICDPEQPNHSRGVVGNYSLQDFRSLYMAVCCEEKISDLLLHLESCDLDRTVKTWQVLDPTGRQNLEASLRKFRARILAFIAASLDMVTATSVSMNRDEYHELEGFALVLCREFAMALKCDSGGVDTSLCVAFLSCIESTVCLLASKQGHFVADGPRNTIDFCQDIIRTMDTITAVLNLTVFEIVESILSLMMIALPAYADAVLRECCSNEKAEVAKDLAGLSAQRHTLLEKCLQRNLCQTRPLEESHTNNTSALISAQGKYDIKSLDGSSTDPVDRNFIDQVSKLIETDRTYEWVFAAMLRAYRDALYYATQSMQVESFCIQTEESRLSLGRLIFQEWRRTLQNILSLLEIGWGKQKGKKSQSGVTNLPPSVKDWLCAVLEQLSATLTVALMCINDLFSDGSGQLHNTGNLEAFCLLLCWLRLPEDPLQRVRPWLASEERIAARANAKQSVVVAAADGSCTKELARVVDHLDELTPQLDRFRHYLAGLPPRSLFYNDITLRGHIEGLAGALCEDSLDWNDCLKARWQALLGGTSHAKVKIEKSSTLPSKRKKRKYTATSLPVARNRNHVVLDWLQKDKGTGEGKLPDDTFADLEDFLVED